MLSQLPYRPLSSASMHCVRVSGRPLRPSCPSSAGQMTWPLEKKSCFGGFHRKGHYNNLQAMMIKEATYSHIFLTKHPRANFQSTSKTTHHQTKSHNKTSLPTDSPFGSFENIIQSHMEDHPNAQSVWDPHRRPPIFLICSY